MPRHPPCALYSLSTQTLNKNYKDTTHYKNNPQQTHTPTSHQPHQLTPPSSQSQTKSSIVSAPVYGGQHVRSSWDARVHYQVIKHQENTNPAEDFHPLRPDSSGPNSVPNQTCNHPRTDFHTPDHHDPQKGPRQPAPYSGTQVITRRRSSMIPLVNTTNAHHTATPTNAGAR